MNINVFEMTLPQLLICFSVLITSSVDSRELSDLNPVQKVTETEGKFLTPAPAFCKEKAETGPCRGAMPRFAFSKETSKCERFTYGGCEGNKNNFVDVEQCQKVCGDGTKLKDRSSGDKTTEKPDKAPAIPVLDGAEKHAASFEDRSNDNSATTTLKSSVVDKMDVKSPSGLVGGIGG